MGLCFVPLVLSCFPGSCDPPGLALVSVPSKTTRLFQSPQTGFGSGPCPGAQPEVQGGWLMWPSSRRPCPGPQWSLGSPHCPFPVGTTIGRGDHSWLRTQKGDAGKVKLFLLFSCIFVCFWGSPSCCYHSPADPWEGVFCCVWLLTWCFRGVFRTGASSSILLTLLLSIFSGLGLFFFLVF